MLKNLVQLEHVVEEKVCRFVCDHDTQINVIKDALVKFLGYVANVEQQIVANQKAQEEATKEAVAPIEVALAEQEQPKAE